jgi:hypothetical protein
VSISANPSSSIQFGTALNITATVTANPPPNTAKWQRKPQNGAWSDIDINNSMYTGSSVTPSAPLLVISSITYSEENVTFRCVVGNAEGETISNDVTIDVTGSTLYLYLVKLIHVYVATLIVYKHIFHGDVLFVIVQNLSLP